jgi:hypothetical protein
LLMPAQSTRPTSSPMTDLMVTWFTHKMCSMNCYQVKFFLCTSSYSLFFCWISVKVNHLLWRHLKITFPNSGSNNNIHLWTSTEARSSEIDFTGFFRLHKCNKYLEAFSSTNKFVNF